MVTNTISKFTSIVKENKPIHVEFTGSGTPAVLTSVVAKHFGRNHKDVLRDIANLRHKCPKLFYERNFAPVEYLDSKGEKRPAYLLTRDGFTLLVMGFTGAAAVVWKLKYIEAFNSLEAAVLQNQTELAREAGYAHGLAEARALPAAEADRKAAYLDGMKEGTKLQKRQDGLTRLLKIRAYVQMGLTHREIGKILGIDRRRVGDVLARSRKAGLAA